MPIDIEKILAGLPAYGPPTQAQDELMGYGMSASTDPSGAWRTGDDGQPFKVPKKQLVAYPRANINEDELSIMERQPEFANQLRSRLERLNTESPEAGRQRVEETSSNLSALNDQPNSMANEIANSALQTPIQAQAPPQEESIIPQGLTDFIKRMFGITDERGKNRLDAAFDAAE